MTSIIDSIKAEADKGIVDARKDLSGLLAKLGVNTEDEHQVFHGLLIFIVKAMEAGVAAEVQNLGGTQS